MSSSYSHCTALYEGVNVLADCISQLTLVVQNISKGILSGYDFIINTFRKFVVHVKSITQSTTFD